MKNIIIIFLLLTSFSARLYAQTEKQIADVELMRTEIKNSISLMDKIVIFNDTSGYKYVYKKDKATRLVMINYRDTRDAGRFIDKKIEWYFTDEKLLYCEQVWVDINTNELLENQKCYFINGQLIAWIKTDKSFADPASQEFIDMAGSLLTYGQKLIGETKILIPQQLPE